MGAVELVLGPLLRHVTDTSATIWVETAKAAEVTVRTASGVWSARTFRAHGHHYALVELDGLASATAEDYTVDIDGSPQWPQRGGDFPPSRVSTLSPGKPLRLLFGSCRTSVSHDEDGVRTHGVDALRAYAMRLAREERGWPDLVAFLGDQVYADETSEEMREFIAARRSLDEEPGTELRDYEEYAHLYRIAWGDPATRWLLSTLPSVMIFDDHDIRDDWNTSASWREDMEQTSWWHRRIVGGLGSYWIYQHLGNLTASERAQDPLWQRVLDGGPDGGEVDLTDDLDAFADRVDREPETYRWSYARRIGECRLVVVDSRAARSFRDGDRRMLDTEEMAWLDEQLQGDCEHLLVATSLPFLLPEGLHNVEAWSEALAGGGWGRLGRWWGERLRRAGDLEHWAAFQDDFQRVAEMVVEVAEGRRGAAPRTVTFLSGDVHHSYLAEVRRGSGSQILQAVCSPIRNPLPVRMRHLTALGAHGLASPLGALAARSAKVPPQPFRWGLRERPHYDNNLATLAVTDTGYDLAWDAGVVVGDDYLHPRLTRVAQRHVRT